MSRTVRTIPILDVVKLHHEGNTPRQIGEMYGVGEIGVRQRLISAGEYKPEIGLMKGPRGFTAKQEEQIVSEYKEGTSIYRLSVLHSTTYETIKAILIRQDIQLVSAGYTSSPGSKTHKDIDVVQLVREHKKGATPNQLATKHNCSTPTIRARLKKAGAYKPRPTGQNSNAKGWHIDPSGYKHITDKTTLELFPFTETMARKPGGKGKTRAIPLHRMVMAEHLGRALLPTEQVHHIDGNKLNNDISNLQLHQKQHGNGVALRCSCCGSTKLEPYELN